MKKFIRKRWSLILAIMIAAFVIFAAQAQATEYWKQKFERFSATAGETLSIGDVVCIYSPDSRAYKADADNTALVPAVGVIGKGGSNGETVEIVTRGILAGQCNDVSPGQRLYLSTTAGAFTTATSNYAQPLGVALPGTSTEVAESRSSVYFVNVDSFPLSPSVLH